MSVSALSFLLYLLATFSSAAELHVPSNMCCSRRCSRVGLSFVFFFLLTSMISDTALQFSGYHCSREVGEGEAKQLPAVP